MTDNKNMLLAIVLSAIVLIGWQFFVGLPQMQRQQQQAQRTAQQTASQEAPQPQAPGAPGAPAPAVPGGTQSAPALATRAAVVAANPRVPIETPRYIGSIDLKGGRIDDLALRTYRETINPNSPNVVLLSPSGTPIRQANHHDVLENEGPYYADFGWVAQPGTNLKVPGPDTVWKAAALSKLTTSTPVILEWDNGEGLLFRRTISVDSTQMFTVSDAVENKGSQQAQLSPFALISRHGTPLVAGYYILHEGLIGVMGSDGLQEYTYSNIDKDASKSWKATSGWLGITDKYWANTLIPDQSVPYTARFTSSTAGSVKTYQTDLLYEPKTVAPGGKAETTSRLFSGAKEVALVDGYETSLGISRFELLIDWGWFYFITKPLFKVIDWLYRLVRQFRRVDPDRHRAPQAPLLPARQQVLRLDVEDEEGAA